MKFIPFGDQVEIKPFSKKGSVLSSEIGTLLEAGEVVAVGENVTFLKVGDVVHFEAFGCSKTTDSIDGTEHYVVLVTKEVIRGKHVKE